MAPKAYVNPPDRALRVSYAVLFVLLGVGGAAEYAPRPALAVSIAGVCLLFAALCFRAALRMGVFTDRSGVTIRGAYRTACLAWDDIQSFAPRRVPDGYVRARIIVAQLHDGNAVKLPLPARRRADLDSLNADLAAVRAGARS